MKALLRLKPFVRPYVPLIIISALMAIPLAALRLSPAPLVKYMVDHLLVDRDPKRLLMFPALVLAIYGANFVVRFFHYYLLRVAIHRINQDVKNKLYDHLLGLSADHFTAQSVGSLISRVGNDPQYIDQGLSTVNILIREPFTFIMLFGYALRLNWKLTVVTLTVLPALAWVFAMTAKHLKRYIGKIAEENARITSALQESFSGIRVIKTFRLENRMRERFHERTGAYTQFLLKTAILEEVSHPLVEMLTAVIIAAVIYFGGRKVIHGTMTSGDLMAFLTTLALMMNPLRNLNDVNVRLNQTAGACTRIFEILDWKSNLRETPHPRTLERFEQGIELDHVSFAYPDAPQRPILRDVSFKVARGQVVALVGASGAGKSSLVSLLPRIFDVTAGAIRIDGTDIRDFSLESLRSHIAVVSQDVFLFNDTITDNIRCGRQGATLEEIREAARRAHALDFIETLPDGFDSVVSDRGQKLSGGERQRVSIARAFLREAPILILDEATSSLDSTSERAVQSALDELMVNRTTLVIAHRLSTIRHADLILVIKDGEVVERGRHEDLVQKGGEYARFHAAHPV